MNGNGFKFAWLLGGIISLIWLPLLGLLWLLQGQVIGALLSLAVFGAGVAYVLLLPPWRLPHTPIRRLYLGLLGIILVGIGLVVWQYSRAAESGQGLPLVVLFTFLLPGFMLGRKTWADLHPEDR